MLTPHIKTTIPNTFGGHVAGIYSNAELDQFWNRNFFQNILILHFNFKEKL